MTAAPVIAVILAGGRGERLGGAVKASVSVGGVTLLERVARRLADATCTTVALGSFTPDDVGLLPGHIGIRDLPTSYAGPLAGLAAVTDWVNRLGTAAPDTLLLSAAVDTPFLPPGYLGTMAAAIEPGHAAVVARYGAQDYPTNAIWRLSRIADLPARLADGTASHSLKNLATELGAATLNWPDSEGGDPFANVNTPADLRALEQRAEAADALARLDKSGLGNAEQTR